MNDVVLILGQTPVTLREIMIVAAVIVLVLLILLVWQQRKAAQRHAIEAAAAAERQREMDDKVQVMNMQQAELNVRLQALSENMNGALVRPLSDRLDSLRSAMGEGMKQQSEQTIENLGKLNERLAVIDAAQQNLSNLTGEVLALKDILANKQARGAFGQGQMEAIIRDGLPPSAYGFQTTLSNRSRPDCTIRLPGDDRLLVIDSKFPLEGFQLLETSKRDEHALQQAHKQVRGDLGRHISDIADRYLIPGETQDMAFLFIPSESLYATIAEHFDDVIQKAHRQRVIIVSPSLLMMAIQVMQAIVRDHRMREQAGVLQREVGHLMDDVRRLQERVGNLDTHFRQAQKDVGEISTSAEKIGKRSGKIQSLDFEEGPPKVEITRAAE
jgi:DNA recombination protein RmuC